MLQKSTFIPLGKIALYLDCYTINYNMTLVSTVAVYYNFKDQTGRAAKADDKEVTVK